MIRIIFGVLMIMHGLVHLLYFAQSARYFSLQPGMVWPDGSWAFSRFLADQRIRMLACLSCITAAIGFVTGGIGILLWQSWWRPAIIGSAAFSALLFFLFWDGAAQNLDNKGAIGLLINLAILAAMLMLPLT